MKASEADDRWQHSPKCVRRQNCCVKCDYVLISGMSGVFLHRAVPFCVLWVPSWCRPAWQGLSVLTQHVRWAGRMEGRRPAGWWMAVESVWMGSDWRDWYFHQCPFPDHQIHQLALGIDIEGESVCICDCQVVLDRICIWHFRCKRLLTYSFCLRTKHFFMILEYYVL